MGTAASAIRGGTAGILPTLGSVGMKGLSILPDVLTVLMTLRPIRNQLALILTQILTVVACGGAIPVYGTPVLTNRGIVLSQGLTIFGDGICVTALSVGTQGIQVLPALVLGLIQRASILSRLSIILTQVSTITVDVLPVSTNVLIVLANISTVTP